MIQVVRFQPFELVILNEILDFELILQWDETSGDLGIESMYFVFRRFMNLWASQRCPHPKLWNLRVHYFIWQKDSAYIIKGTEVI